MLTANRREEQRLMHGVQRLWPLQLWLKMFCTPCSNRKPSEGHTCRCRPVADSAVDDITAIVRRERSTCVGHNARDLQTPFIKMIHTYQSLSVL